MDNKEFSQDNKNLEIINQDEKKSDAVVLNHDGLDVKKGGNIIIGTLNIVMRPLKKRHERHYKESKFHLVADLVLVLLVLVLGGYLAWVIFFYTPIHELSVEIKSINNEILSGRDEVFEIIYKNESQKTINEAKLAVNFPKNFFFKKAVPENIYNKNTNYFDIGAVPSGGNGKFKIVGTVYGEVGTQQIISSVMSYKNGVNGKKDANFLSSLIYAVESSVLKISLSVPEKIYQNMDFEGKVIVKNLGSSELKNIIISPEGGIFNIKESSCDYDELGFKIYNLKAGQSYEIVFTALAEQTGQQLIRFNSFIKDENIQFFQGAIEEPVEVIIPKFKVSVQTEKNTILADDNIDFVISYKNNEDFEVSDIDFSIELEGENFSLAQIAVVGTNDCSVKNNIISVAKPFKPGESGSVSATAKIKMQKMALNNSTNLIASASYRLDSQKIVIRVLSGKMKLVSNLKAGAAAYYYSNRGDQLGAGPLPPVVNIPTNYWIFFDIENFGNDLNNFVLTADLPDNVYYLGNKSVLSGDLQVAEISKRVIWSVESIDRNNDYKKAGFEISLIPEKADTGKVVDLLKNIKISVYDKFANFTIKSNLSNINSDLKDDKFAGKKGRVLNID